MTQFPDIRGFPRPAAWGVVRLKDHFEQRKIGAVYGSMSSRVPLRTPSGAQFVESALESDLLEQLNFSTGIYDLITQPTITYEVDGKRRRYTPDILAQVYNDETTPPVRYFIEVKREKSLIANADQYRKKFLVACEYAERNSGFFRVMTEREIQTPFLANVRLLAPSVGREPENDSIDRVRAATGDAPITVARFIERLGSEGIGEPKARQEIERIVANGYVQCDLRAPFTDASTLEEATWKVSSSNDSSPILASLRASTWHKRVIDGP